MDAETVPGEISGEPFDTLYAEAKSALAYAANHLRLITERYREAFHEELGRWHEARDELDDAARLRLSIQPAGDWPVSGPADGGTPEVTADGLSPGAVVPAAASMPEAAAEQEAAGASAAAEREAAQDRARILRRSVDLAPSGLGALQAELSRLEIASRGLESAWLFLERGDATLVTDPAMPDLPADVKMRIVEAQEAERTRLAQEVHDGPAQALSNAIFQVEYIDRVLDEDPRVVRAELRFLRERLRRELGDVRAFISQLRPPLLDELGLDGSIADAVETLAALTGAQIETDLTAPAGRLGDAEQTVVLRVLQESLQNVRKHAGARHVSVSTRLEDGRWRLEVRDDGHGFDPAAVAAGGRRNFGLQFMRERAELVRASFEVRSRPAGGTVVTLQIPIGEDGGTG